MNDDDEQNPLPPPQCADGIDNDRDGSDEEDIGCSSVADASEDDPEDIPECADSIDNEDGPIGFPLGLV